MNAIAAPSSFKPNEDGFYMLQGDYKARMEHEGTTTEISYDCTRTYEEDDESTPPAWRIFYDGDRTNIHMPADWPIERVAEAMSWYQKGLDVGYNRGKSAGASSKESEIKDAISLLRDLGIGTTLPQED